MKLNRKTLRKMILSEIKNLQEAPEDYIEGLVNKIARLENELEREQAFYHKTKSSHPLYSGEHVDDFSYYDKDLSNMHASEDRIETLKKKIDFLEKQLDARFQGQHLTRM